MRLRTGRGACAIEDLPHDHVRTNRTVLGERGGQTPLRYSPAVFSEAAAPGGLES